MGRDRPASGGRFSRRILSLVTFHPGLKLLSLFLAGFLWFQVNLNNPALVVEKFQRPIELYNLDDELISVQLAPEAAQVNVVAQGRRSDLIFKRRQIHFFVDLKNVKSPIGRVTLGVDSVVPPYFQLMSYEPKAITLIAGPPSHLASPGPS